MPNYRFTIWIKQDFDWYYIKDITLIYKCWVKDMARVSANKVQSVMEWSRVLTYMYIYIYVYIYIYIYIYLVFGL